MASYVRGNRVFITADAFLDQDDVEVVPATADVTLRYIDASYAWVRTTFEMELQSDNTYFLEWDSSVALPCVVTGSIRTTDPVCAQDFTFTLTANRANPDPESET